MTLGGRALSTAADWTRRQARGLWTAWRRGGGWIWLAGWAARLILFLIGASVALVLLFRFVNPPITLLMTLETWRLGGVERSWRPIEEMSPALRRAAIAAEDARFCDHQGFDVPALKAAIAVWRGGGPLRGASTISQQTAKNVYLWPARSLPRKAVEFWFTALIEVFWPKRRILEVYLNVAEFGPGVFGAEAGAQAAFDRPASELTLKQAARLVSVLPAPRRFRADDGGASRRARVAAIEDGALTLRAAGRDRCVVDDG